MLHWDKVSVINSVSISPCILKLGLLQNTLLKVWMSRYVLLSLFTFLDVEGTLAAFVCCLSHIQVILNLVLSQWGDLGPFLSNLLQRLLVDPHLMHSKYVQMVVVPQAFSVLHILLSLMTCTATSLSLNFQDKCMHAELFSIKWQCTASPYLCLCGINGLPARVLSHCSCTG